jgi:uncharacterized membrane protein
MLTYAPLDPRNPSEAGYPGLRGNPLEGAIGPVNVGEAERYGSLFGGAALVLAGLSRRSLPGLLLAALGGAFVMRGLGGNCKLYEGIGVSTAASGRSGVPDGTGTRVEQIVLIKRPPAELFNFWRNLENLPAFMDNIESVRTLDDRRSHWVIKGPGGHPIEWDAEIVNEHAGEMISWQTLPGADVQSAGTVRFTPTDGGTATNVRVILEFHPPAGAVGAQIARIIGHDPASKLTHDLNRLKEIMESRNVVASAR